MTSQEIILGLLLAGLLWFWLDSIRSKELATAFAKRLCSQSQVMLLDDSVGLRRLSLARNRQGSISLKRVFQFEFASDGALRYQGHISMLGSQFLGSEMDVYRMTED